MLQRIKKNDLVSVISGKDKGKQGHVIALDRKKARVIVKGVAIITRHVKSRRQGEKGGIVKEEGFMRLDKLMPVCPSCKKTCRMQVKKVGKETKSRVCHRCKEVF